MLQYKAEWVGESDGKHSRVQVTSQQGVIFHWSDELLAEMQRFTTRRMSKLTCEPEGTDLMAVDNESVLLITDTSLRKLEQLWGKPLDQRRFRAIIIITLLEDTPFIEAEWVGRKLQIGNAVLLVNVQCERCTVVTLDPDIIVKDATLLKKLIEERKQFFGVYATVVKPGLTHHGDAVYLV